MNDFPIKPCMVCNKDIENLDGLVVADNYAKAFELSAGRREKIDSNFFEVVVFQYKNQFVDFFQNLKQDCNLDDFLDVVNRRFNVQDYRRHLKLFLVAHYSCIKSETALAKKINLDELKGCEVEWGHNWSNEPWYNDNGWKIVLEHLYGPGLKE